MDAILRLVEILNQYLWNSLLLVALVGTGVYFTILLHPALPLTHIQYATLAAAVCGAKRPTIRA